MRSASAFVAAVSPIPRGGFNVARAAATCTPSSLRSVAAPAFAARAAAIPMLMMPGTGISRRSRRVRTMAAAKQMDTDWNSVKVLENSVICEDHRYLVINVGTTAETGSLCDAYRVPGMYVQMRSGKGCKPGFFAISCAPNIQGVFEFLIKDAEATGWLVSLKAGDSVEMSPIMGKGFPISSRLALFGYPAIPEERQPTEILLFATGSGIAPIRAAIESRLNGINPAQRKSVKLYYGARYPERMAYMDRFKLWESDRVEVIPVMSRSGDASNGWTGRTGYVQEALKEDGIAKPAKTGVILCGVKGMIEDVTAFCKEAGVPEDRILTNF